MKQLKHYTINGILFVLISGSLAHFFYEWSGHNPIVGLFTPVNESIWEHMKLIFYTMLAYSHFIVFKKKADYPCIPYALGFWPEPYAFHSSFRPTRHSLEKIFLY